ncbi:ATP-dependent DNA helicase 2 subunit 1 [Chironomus tepperi]|uniref:ATP-dependent DNA helicase 2 subunit 1 n=1 Tax=Chironomus tepperi TaxID=113505 RepID=UPI00391F8D1F
MALNFTFDHNYDSDDEDNDQKFVYDGKDLVLFVIDVSKSMFEKVIETENNKISPIDVTLSALDLAFREKVRRSVKDLNGIIFYNTEKSPDPKDAMDSSIIAPSNCAVFMPLHKVEADSIRFIKNTKESDDYNDFDNRYGHSNNAKISDVLWLCNSLVSHCGSKVHSLTVFWITDNQIPHDLNSVLYNEAMAKAKDLQYLKMHFELCPMRRDFDIEKFYTELMSKVMDTEVDALDPTFTFDVQTLKTKFMLHDPRCRALSYLTVEISDKAKFGVGIYSQLSKTKEPKPVMIDRKSKEVVRSHRNFKYGKLEEAENDIEAEINFDQKLTADKSVKYLEIGGRKVKFTPLEVYEMKQVIQPKVKILGFKPKESFNPINHKRSCYFVFPNDKHIKNSTKMFRALWETCLKSNKIVYCAFSMRLKSYPELAVMIPVEENEDLYTNDGFLLEFLPYTEDIRDVSKFIVKDTEEECEEDEAIDKAMASVMSKLTVNYDPMYFRNPVIAKIYNKLEEIEFNEDPEEFEDTTMPDTKLQEDRIGKFVATLSDIFGGFEEASTTKRKAPKSTDGPPGKKRAAEDINFDLVHELCKKNDIKSLTNDMLKDYLKFKNVSGLTKLKKADLVQLVVNNP